MLGVDEMVDEVEEGDAKLLTAGIVDVGGDGIVLLVRSSFGRVNELSQRYLVVLRSN